MKRGQRGRGKVRLSATTAAPDPPRPYEVRVKDSQQVFNKFSTIANGR